MILKLSLDLPEDKAYVRITRLLSRTLLEDLGALPGDVDDIEVIVSELCTNVVRHAHSDAGRHHIALEYHHGKVVILVEDTGGGFSPAVVPPPGTGRADPEAHGGERIGGFGLPLIGAISDRLEFRATQATEPHGLTVRAERAFGYQSRGARERAEERDGGVGQGEAEVTATASGSAASPIGSSDSSARRNSRSQARLATRQAWFSSFP